MNHPNETRRFLRFVIAAAIVANGTAGLVVQGERELRPFAVASTLDQLRMELSNDVANYGTAVKELHERARTESAP